MKRFLVIADDLSGAYDIGMQIQKTGLNVLITDKNIDIDENDERDAYIFDSETRNMNCRTAYKKIKNFASKTDISDYGFLYKKIDSTLRGNICSEIRALDEIIKFDLIVVASAYPALSRIVLNEIVFLNGNPVTQTDIALDPECSGCKENIKEILEEGLKERVEHVDINKLRKSEYLKENNKLRIISFDTILDDDMDIIISKYVREHKKILWVGSIGLMQALLRYVCHMKTTLSIVGSVSDISREQIEYAEQRGVYVVFIDIKEILNEHSSLKYCEVALHNIKAGRDVIICTTRKREDVISGVEIKREKIMRLINIKLADLAIDILNRVSVEGVLITGGDTANCLIRKLADTYPQIITEVMPSIPLTLLKTKEQECLKVIIKSGHVGDKETIFYCINKLKENIFQY